MNTKPLFVTAVLLLFLTPLLAQAEPPNVLMIVADDLAASMGSYGNKVCQTPNLDRLAAEGVRFNNAYCQYPVCGPSRASFMSGLYPNVTRMLKNSYNEGAFKNNKELAEHPSIGGFLRRNGYVSMRISKIYHMGIPGGIESGDPGGDDPDSWDRAFNLMAPETASPGGLELLSPIRKHYGSNFARVIVPDEFEETQTDYMAASQAIAILENRANSHADSKFLRREEPFFLAVGFVRPHVPLVAPERIFAKYPADAMVLPEVPEGDLDDVPEAARGMENMGRYGMNEQQQKESIAAYYASITFMDEQVGRLLDTLDRLDQRKNTVVIFTSDHGYNMGQHHCWQKLSLFEDSTRVPLYISAPGLEASAGKSCESVVELIDLYPTITELTGLADKAPSILQGASLLPQLTDPATPTNKAAYTVTYNKGESLRTAKWRYNFWDGSGEELYDHENDPGEFTNQASNPEYAKTLADMQEMLEQKREASRTLPSP